MTDNAMTKRKKCNQKQYMVCQNMQWLREQSVIKRVHGMTDIVMAKRSKRNLKHYMV